MLEDLPESITTDPNTLYTFHSYVPFLLTHQGAGWAGDFIVHVTGLPYPLDRLGQAELDRRVAEIKARMLRDAPPGRADELPPYLDELLDEISTPARLRKMIEKPFREAAAFAETNDIAPGRILLGEFGMIRREFDKDAVMPAEWRIDYIRDVRKIAEEYGFAWSVWGYSGAFGMVEGFGGEPVEGNAAAAILRD